MAKILYGLAGEGMGHATRSKVVIDHLIQKGHSIHIVASNRAYDFLSGNKATKIPGLKLVYENNTVDKLKSIWINMKPKEGQESVEIVRKIILEEQPDLIITDYEPTVAHLAGLMSWDAITGKKKIPLISIDNMHVISNCKIEVLKKYYEDYMIVKYGNDMIVPPQNVKKFIITTFFYPEVGRKNTILVPSLVRDKIVKAKTGQEDYLLVYQTSQSNTAMFDILKSFEREKFVIYGFNIQKKEKNLIFKKFSEDGFI
ncbi:MAG: glycosyltransferase family protein, partial [Candidatus Woesearchaeota archaeon]